MRYGKHLTREQRRAFQRRQADLLGVGVILAVVALGFAVGRMI